MTKRVLDANKLNAGIKLYCERRIGVIDSDFLCQSLSVLNPATAVTVNEQASVAEAVSVLQQNKVGCVIIVNADGKLSGIFSERDCMLKIVGKEGMLQKPVTDFMTADPMSGTIDTTIAYALTLMSEGGFRHIPITDEDGKPVGIISVKNVVDYIVKTFVNDLLEFDVDEFA